MGLFVRSWSPVISHWLFVYNINRIFSTCDGACSEIMFEFEWRATYISSLRTKLTLAHLGIPSWVWPSMNGYKMFFDQTSTQPPSMHRKRTKHERCCMQNNQLPTDSHVELEENCNACWLLRGLSSFLNLFIILDGTGGHIWSYETPGCKILPIRRCEKRCRL